MTVTTVTTESNPPIAKIVVLVLLVGIGLYLAIAHPWWLVGLIVVGLFIPRLFAVLGPDGMVNRILLAEETMGLTTTLPVPRIATIFRDTLSEANRRVEFKNIETSRSPFAQFEDQPDFAVAAIVVRSRLHPVNSWLVRVYILDEGTSRDVGFEIVGSPGWVRVLMGVDLTFSRSRGLEQAEHVVERLRRADPALRLAS